SFIPSMMRKISSLKKMIDERQCKVDIQVDGGISLNNIQKVAKAGANCFVAGSSIFSAPDPAGMISQMRRAAES
ncbi:MAG: ribulose-phosphate 3-epimerase, partial [Caldicoprobacterales bacterium]